MPEFKKPRGARYTPLSRRQDRPNAILWLLRNHAELKDAQIMRLVGTTKHTLEAIRERSHWNSANLQPMDPVTLGLCSQIDLDFEVNRAAKDRPKTEEPQGPTLVPAEITTARPDAFDRQRRVRRAHRAQAARGGAHRRRRGVRQAQGAEAGGMSRPVRARRDARRRRSDVLDELARRFAPGELRAQRARARSRGMLERREAGAAQIAVERAGAGCRRSRRAGR